MARWGYLEITRTCMGCGRKLPVNGPVEHVRCASCFTVNPIPMMVHGQVLEIIETDRSEIAEGEIKSQTPLTTGGVYNLTWGTHAPKCRECGTVLPEAGPEDMHCPGCGVICTSFAPTGLYAQLYPAIRQVVLGEREAIDPAGAQQQVSVDQSRTKPILMACDNCSGSLSITASTPRLHDCQYCGVKVGIPEDLWDRLHPVESTKGWYVRFEGPLAKVPDELEREMDRRYDEEALGPGMGAGKPKWGPSRWARLQVATRCPSCKDHVPINGPLPYVVCPECGTVRDLVPEHVGGFMSWVGDEQPVFDGTAFRSQGHRFQMKCTRVAASCALCDAELPVVEIGTDTTIRCPGCTARYATFPVPETYMKHAGHARQLYCAQKDPDPPPGEGPGTLTFSCPSCGAELGITSGTGRIHRCEFCSSDVFIPDELWTRFHPVTRVHPWFVDAGTVPPRPEGSVSHDDDDDDDVVKKIHVPKKATGKQAKGQGSGKQAKGQDSEKRGLILIFAAVGALLVIATIMTILGSC